MTEIQQEITIGQDISDCVAFYMEERGDLTYRPLSGVDVTLQDVPAGHRFDARIRKVLKASSRIFGIYSPRKTDLSSVAGHPADVSEFAVDRTSITRLVVSWDAPSVAAKTLVQISTNNASWSTVAVVPAGDNEYFHENLSGLTNGTFYFRAKHVFDNGDQSENWTTSGPVVVDTTLRAVTSVTLVQTGAGALSITWDAGTDVAGDNDYLVEIDLALNGGSYTPILVGDYIASDEAAIYDVGEEEGFDWGVTAVVRIRRAHALVADSANAVSNTITTASMDFSATEISIPNDGVETTQFSRTSNKTIVSQLWEYEFTPESGPVTSWTPFGGGQSTVASPLVVSTNISDDTAGTSSIRLTLQVDAGGGAFPLVMEQLGYITVVATG